MESGIREIATPDVEWGATGAFPGVEGMYRGTEAMQKWMEVIRSEWKDFEVTLDEVLYDSGDVVAPSGSEAEYVKAVQRSRCASSRPTGSSMPRRLPLVALLPYPVLALACAVAAIIMSDPGSARGYYWFLSHQRPDLLGRHRRRGHGANARESGSAHCGRQDWDL
jgi:hypothetical protein